MDAAILQAIGQLGGAGILIWYLLNQDKNKNDKLLANMEKVQNSIDDLTLAVLDSKPLIVTRIKQNIKERQESK